MRSDNPVGQGDAPPPLRRPVALLVVAGVLLVATLALMLAVRAGRSRPVVATYVGSERCEGCHPSETAAWRPSNHARAMQVANEKTVLGDFNGASLEHRGKTWRFFRKADRFVVSAEGPDGAMHDYEVAYTFGVAPLQQYLVPFPGGRLQALSAGWDVQQKRWFHVDPHGPAAPTDWLHWSRAAQNWNGMCADCHSTNLQKGYDPDSDSYRTTWSEVSVGCEACHGPSSLHVAWAEKPEGKRPNVENAALVTRTSRLTGQELADRCATCHARRAQFADQGVAGGELLDRYLPVLLSTGLFHPDGQVLDEDFEWQAFSQSKMYAFGVRCTDCHDAHSGKRLAEGNALCTRCHQADAYDAPSHHFHKAEWEGKPSAAVLCVSCHMPGQNYMVVHFRRDHSIRVPRPDLTASLGVPNACSGCHADKPLSWVQARYDVWYGKTRKPSAGTTIAAGRQGAPGAEPALVKLAADVLRPTVTRATALDLLGSYAGPTAAEAIAAALADPEPLIRATAVRQVPGDAPTLVRLLTPLLGDPIRAVRSQAAARLAGAPARLLAEPARKAYDTALAEQIQGQRYMSDLPSGPFNLGNLYAALGRPVDAEREYRRALKLDDQLFMALTNLATLLAGRGQLEEAEQLLRQAHQQQPRQPGIALNLGLLLAERGNMVEAEQMLRAALAADPQLAPAAFNLAVLVGQRSPAEAMALTRRATELRPEDPRYAWTFAYYQSRAGDLAGAAATLERLVAAHPEDQNARALQAEVRERQRRGGRGR
ncbi:MAG: tetratricopeptide repeat protein [Myxococcaceae bacterium]